MSADNYQDRVKKIRQKQKQEKAGFLESDPVADWLMGGQFVIYKPALAHMLGSVTAAVMLGKIWFWSNTAKARQREGWFYWSQVDVTKQTGLTRTQTDSARRLLTERGILRTELKGIPATTWWYLEKAEFFRQVREYIDSLEDDSEDDSEDS